MIVACLQVGNYCNRGREYVEKLHRAVSKNLSLPFTFECFTDDQHGYPAGITKRALPYPGLKHWFHKLSLFKPGVFPDGERVLYLDLDTLIVGSLDGFANYAGDIAMIEQFFADVNPNFSGYQSGVMSWRAGSVDYIWQAYEKNGLPETRGGDQAFMNYAFKQAGSKPDTWGDVLPGQLVSYKAGNMLEQPQVSIVCCHGLPRPHHCGGWVSEYWR